MIDTQAKGTPDQRLVRDPQISVDLAPSLRLSNPVMIASGPLGYEQYGTNHISHRPLSELGAVITKTVTREFREGNPEPRQFPDSYRHAWDTGDHLFLNAYGLNNPGIEAVIEKWVPKWAKWNATMLFSIAAHSDDEFREMAAMAEEADGINALELNLSCPNVEKGLIFSYSADLTRRAVSAVKANTDLPVLAKLSPNVPDITKIALAAVEGGADALTICNTLPAMRIDLTTRSPVLGNVTGGLSGMSLRPVSLALVYQTANALRESGSNVPIIGVGGIFEAEHVVEYILAGATAVQIGSANWVDPSSPWRILAGLRKYLADRGICSLDELRGAAHPVSVG